MSIEKVKHDARAEGKIERPMETLFSLVYNKTSSASKMPASRLRWLSKNSRSAFPRPDATMKHQMKS